MCIACGADGEADGSSTNRGNVLLLDENNYSSTSSLTIPSIDTAAEADLDICWTDVMDDIQCHDIAPDVDLDNVALLRLLGLSESEAEQRLVSGELAQNEIAGYVDFHTEEETCTKLSDFSFVGTPVDVQSEYVETTQNTYLLLLTEGTTPGIGARTFLFLRPTANSTNTTVNALPGCGMLDFSADIASSEPVDVPMDGPWEVDWRDITKDSTGLEVVPQVIDRLLVGFYEGLTVSDLEAQVFDLELISTSQWELELTTARRSADLADAVDVETGDEFPGFESDAEGTWLVGLFCTTCQNPAPIVLSVINPI